MRELKLKYFIELASNIGSKARSEAQALEQSQQAMQRAVDKTSATVGRLDSAFARFAANSATERQIGYMARLGVGIDQAAAKMRGLTSLATELAKKTPAAVAGAAAGLYAAKAITDKPVDYSLTLARMANTAYSERDTAGRTAGKAELNSAIMAAVRSGGGTRADAAQTLNDLIASGVVNVEQAKAMLPSLMRGATGSGAAASQLGAIGVRASQTMGIPLSDIGDILDEANAAGKAGGFELPNMAKDLPAAMAAGKQSGLTGRDGFRKIVAMMQASVITAGTKDEASNNVVNLLGKINSDDTKNDFKKQGIDLRGELLKGRANGADSVDTFVGLVDRIAGKDAQYAKLKKQLSLDTTDGAKKETMSSMADILQGKAIGGVVQDRQALMSLVAVMNNRGYVKDIQAKMAQGKGSLGADFDLIKAEASSKLTAAVNEKDEAVSNALAKVVGPLGSMVDGTTQLAREFPGLATAAAGAAGALTLMTAAAGVFSLLAMRNAGGLGLPGRPGGGLPGGLGSPGAYPVLDGAKAAGGTSKLARLLGIAGAVAGPAAGLIAMEGVSGEDANRLRSYESKRAQFGDGRSIWESMMGADWRPDPNFKSADNHRGKGFNDPRLMTLTTPSIAEQTLAAGSATKIEMGEGKLMIDVRVTNDGQVTATPLVTQQPALMKLSGGATNPGSVR